MTMDIVVFVRAVRTMRQAQKDYFRTRLPAILIEAKQMEKVVDKTLEDGAIQVTAIVAARQLRLAYIKDIYKRDFITEDEAKELLAASLTPGDDRMVYDDSALLNDPEAFEKIAAQKE
jgi:hypothetical protein